MSDELKPELTRAELRAARGLPRDGFKAGPQPPEQPAVASGEAEDRAWIEGQWVEWVSEAKFQSFGQTAMRLALAAIARERARAQAGGEVWTEDEIRKRFEDHLPSAKGQWFNDHYVSAHLDIAWRNFLAGVRAAQRREGAE